MPQSTKVINPLTIDVEDYFQVHAFSAVIRPEDWDSFEPMVEKNTNLILDLLDSLTSDELSATSYELGNVPRATFFVLGWIAERYPALVREIFVRGHEVACHGYDHRCVFNQTKEDFREDVRRAKEILENLIGAEVIGYRAPTFSIRSDTLWALEILFELGFHYDSSIYPVKHDFYGFPKAPRFPFYIDFANGDLLSQFENPKYLDGIENPDNGDTKKPSSDRQNWACDGCFVEFPLSTISFLGWNLPFCGGGYFRLFPYWFTKWGLRNVNKRCQKPAISYLHPWELNPEIPRIGAASWMSKFRTYVNLKETAGKLNRLLTEFKFAPLASFIK